MQGGAARIANPPVGLRMLTGLGGPPLGSVLPQRDPQTIPRLAAGELKEQSSADDSCASDTQPDGASSEQLFQTWLEELHRQGVTVEVVLKEGSGASIKMGDGEPLHLTVLIDDKDGKSQGILHKSFYTLLLWVNVFVFVWGISEVSNALGGHGTLAAMTIICSYIGMKGCLRAL